MNLHARENNKKRVLSNNGCEFSLIQKTSIVSHKNQTNMQLNTTPNFSTGLLQLRTTIIETNGIEKTTRTFSTVNLKYWLNEWIWQESIYREPEHEQINTIRASRLLLARRAWLLSFNTQMYNLEDFSSSIPKSEIYEADFSRSNIFSHIITRVRNY